MFLSNLCYACQLVNLNILETNVLHLCAGFTERRGWAREPFVPKVFVQPWINIDFGVQPFSVILHKVIVGSALRAFPSLVGLAINRVQSPSEITPHLIHGQRRRA
jgi:hypothetical protein